MSEVLNVTNLSQSYRTRAGIVRAVDSVSFSIQRGETLGLVGESGCGKSSVARSIMGLHRPDAGSIKLLGQEIGGLSRRAMRPHRVSLQMIFQNPSASLNPRLKVGRLIEEPLTVHRRGSKRENADRVFDLLKKVGLRPDIAERYQHELSGGQRQRVSIARALALSPAVILCDEPVSALDVSVQAQIVNLMRDLQDELGVSFLFISHGLAVTQYVSQRIIIMYLGRIVEEAAASELFDNPLHPYTKGLIAAAPDPNDGPKEDVGVMLDGDLPSPLSPPPGCHFHTRCAFAVAECRQIVPQLRDAGPQRKVACHRAEEIARDGFGLGAGASYGVRG